MKVYRFLKRFNLSIRAGTHIEQQLPHDSTDLILKFLNKVITIRKTYNINKENIINVDETALCYNMSFNKQYINAMLELYVFILNEKINGEYRYF